MKCSNHAEIRRRPERLVRIAPTVRIFTDNPYKERIDAQIRDMGEKWVLHPRRAMRQDHAIEGI